MCSCLCDTCLTACVTCSGLLVMCSCLCDTCLTVCVTCPWLLVMCSCLCDTCLTACVKCSRIPVMCSCLLVKSSCLLVRCAPYYFRCVPDYLSIWWNVSVNWEPSLPPPPVDLPVTCLTPRLQKYFKILLTSAVCRTISQ